MKENTRLITRVTVIHCSFDTDSDSEGAYRVFITGAISPLLAIKKNSNMALTFSH